jgi:superoxide dismutase, Fe-Mn family
MNRRSFLFASSGAAAGSLLVSGIAAGQDGDEAPNGESGLATGVAKPLKYSDVPGFLSAAQIEPHHTSHYGGALRAFVGVEDKFEDAYSSGATIDGAAFERMKQIQSSRGNSVILHELYFDGLTGTQTMADLEISRAIAKRFGSVDRWSSDFAASAKSAAGWAMLVVHPLNGRLYNVVSDEHAQGPLWMAVPLVVIDTYEHAFYIDYKNEKAEYVDRFLQFIDWTEADRRFRQVTKI